MNKGALSSYIKEILKEKKIKEGTCGYGIKGKLGKKPAGSHLLRKKDLEEEFLTPNEDGDEAVEKESASGAFEESSGMPPRAEENTGELFSKLKSSGKLEEPTGGPNMSGKNYTLNGGSKWDTMYFLYEPNSPTPFGLKQVAGMGLNDIFLAKYGLRPTQSSTAGVGIYIFDGNINPRYFTEKRFEEIVDHFSGGLGREAKAQRDFYRDRGPTSGTIDESVNEAKKSTKELWDKLSDNQKLKALVGIGGKDWAKKNWKETGGVWDRMKNERKALYIESVNESKKVDAHTMMKMFKNKDDWGDTADQVYMKGGKMVYVDTWFYGQDKALKQLVDSWKPGGHYYDYWFKKYGVKAKITDTFSEIKATGRHKKLTTDGIVGVVLDIIPGVIGSVNEGLSPETVAKAEQIKKTMIGKNRDKLFKAYGKDAEKVAHGRAITQAKKATEKEESVDEAFNSKIDMEELSQELKRLKSENPGKRISYDFISGEVVYKIDGKPIDESVDESYDIDHLFFPYDEVAQAEFGMDYDQLGPGEKEWVRDEIDNMPINETITKKMWEEDWDLNIDAGEKFNKNSQSRIDALIKLGVKKEKAEDWSLHNWDTLPKSVMKLLQEVYSKEQRIWACAQDDPKFDEMCKDTSISKKKTMKENRLSELIKTALKGPIKEEFNGDALEIGKGYQVYEEEDVFEYVGFDRDELEHISSNLGSS